MSEEFVSLTDKFRFKKVNNKRFVFRRDYQENTLYLSKVTAMSFHKVLFGLSELKLLQEISRDYQVGSLKMSEAVFAYYTVYHLMTFCMLLDEEYEIIVFGELKNGKVQLEVNKNLLNSEEDTPKRWREQEKHEKDIASAISHSNIKDYCKSIRGRDDIKNKVVKLIYDHFIALECETIVYEKICYIRDRVIYRPTVVIEDRHGEIVQTSADLNEEISKLPSWERYYKILESIHNKLIEVYDDYDLIKYVLRDMWYSSRIRENRELLYKLGWNDEEIQEYRSKTNLNELTFDSYISHLIEIRDKERVKKELEEIWFPLRDKYRVFNSEYIKEKLKQAIK
ncbi:hypothetical protein [Bacillus tropicus]|uniref:hypothetical protein n=1 Tax=Bacillus tropicus TaxID=2026188 RepID=UPI0023AE7CD6|nr:hypothetical protein [Bacillus tropicus]MDE7550874.1 hypothetical protein [Bacillus tropicus]MDE7572151.1 hypothetical protein [Bacillus tropicus]